VHAIKRPPDRDCVPCVRSRIQLPIRRPSFSSYYVVMLGEPAFENVRSDNGLVLRRSRGNKASRYAEQDPQHVNRTFGLGPDVIFDGILSLKLEGVVWRGLGLISEWGITSVPRWRPSRGCGSPVKTISIHPQTLKWSHRRRAGSPNSRRQPHVVAI